MHVSSHIGDQFTHSNRTFSTAVAKVVRYVFWDVVLHFISQSPRHNLTRFISSNLFSFFSVIRCPKAVGWNELLIGRDPRVASGNAVGLFEIWGQNPPSSLNVCWKLRQIGRLLLTVFKSSAMLSLVVPPGPYKSLKVLKFHTFKYKALKSP